MSMKPSVLVIDDEIDVGVFFRRLLGRKNMQVTMAVDGAEARRLLCEQKFHAAMVDLKLPDTDGLQMLQEIKNQQPNCEVIIMTGSGTTRTAVKAIQLGAYDYLEKPFEDIDELEKLVEESISVSFGQDSNDGTPAWKEKAHEVGFEVGSSTQMHRLVSAAYRIARKKLNVLIHGETGTGKEVLARFIHAASSRADNTFIAVNCGALSENLLESELFGHEKGAFTGAVAQRRGIFELANRGTLFLDEVGEASLSIQVKLLRVLETGEILRVGGEKTIKTDARVIAATNVNLEQAVKEKRFREDLFYRLDVVRLTLPPLRERREDIPLMVNHFVKKFGEKIGQTDLRVSPDCLHYLQNYQWPGNIRELANTIEQAVVMCDGPVILPKHLSEKLQGDVLKRDRTEDMYDDQKSGKPVVNINPISQLQACLGKKFSWEELPPEQLQVSYRLVKELEQRLERALIRCKLPCVEPLSLQEMEARAITKAMDYYDNNISLVARALGIGRTTLYRKMKEYGLTNQRTG